MDLASDILRVIEKVAQAPGLNTACSLAMLIMKTAQISKNNTARLQYLAHSVANHLITIAEHMEGRWDGATDNLKSQLDDFEATLRDICKLVTKYSRSSSLAAFINAGDRDMAIQRLERRLADTRTSILILLGVDVSISLQHIGSGVDRFSHALDSQSFRTQSQLQDFGNRFDQVQVSLGSHESRVEDTYTRVVRIEDVLRGHISMTGHQRVGEDNIPLYNRHEWRLLRTISHENWRVERGGPALTLTLKEAKHRTTGQIVIVRTYEGADPDQRTRLFSRHLSHYTNMWEPNVLQLVGASAATLSIPFQVYDTPGGQVESFKHWIDRTVESNPVEAICGLYDMRTSLKALAEFQASRGVYCPTVFFFSVVDVRINGPRKQWSLIYSGEISHGGSWPTGLHEEYGLMPPIRYASSWSVVWAFLRNSEAWAEDTHGLDHILEHGIQNLDMDTLGSTLLENGWFATSYSRLSPCTTVGLGDIGYATEDGGFVVVDNLYFLLTSADGGPLTWFARPQYFPELPLEDLVEVNYSGKDYRRSKRRKFASWAAYIYVLKYVNLNKRHAWTILRDHAREIISRHSLAVRPHDLKLVISVKRGCMSHIKALPSVQMSPESTTNSMNVGQRRIQDPPFYYIFDEGVHVREEEVPELSLRYRVSFQEEPERLDGDDSLRTEYGPTQKTIRSDVAGRYELYQRPDCGIDYLQLPPGFALPYVEEVVDT